MSVTVWQAVLLGFVQGLTEFLPVSSTAHLALVQHFLPGFSQPGILFDVLLHVGTAAALIVYFRYRLLEVVMGLLSKEPEARRASWKLVGLLVLAVIATAVGTLPLKKMAEEGMTEFRRMGVALICMSALLFLAQRIGKARGEAGRTLSQIRPIDAFLVGLTQTLSAVFHGFSRSGNTISTGLFTGMSRKTAAEFSFLLSIPTILAAAAVETLSAIRHQGTDPLVAGGFGANLAGLLVAGLVGYAAIAILFRLVVNMHLLPFVVYTALLGLVLVVVPL